MATYIGISTINRGKKFTLTDFDLVKQDLYNHFHIRKGQKLMDPNFGTVIWDMLYEPYTESVRDIIKEDIRRILSYDPRLGIENIKLTEMITGILVEIKVRYLPTNQVDVLRINFESRAKG